MSNYERAVALTIIMKRIVDEEAQPWVDQMRLPQWADRDLLLNMQSLGLLVPHTEYDWKWRLPMTMDEYTALTSNEQYRTDSEVTR